jgi:hypothetical protein
MIDMNVCPMSGYDKCKSGNDAQRVTLLELCQQEPQQGNDIGSQHRTDYLERGSSARHKGPRTNTLLICSFYLDASSGPFLTVLASSPDHT